MESDVPGRSRPRHCTRTFLSDKLARQFVEQHIVKLVPRLVGEVVPIAFEDAVRDYLGFLGLIRKSTRNSYSYHFAVFDRGIARGWSSMISPANTSRLRQESRLISIFAPRAQLRRSHLEGGRTVDSSWSLSEDVLRLVAVVALTCRRVLEGTNAAVQSQRISKPRSCS